MVIFPVSPHSFDPEECNLQATAIVLNLRLSPPLSSGNQVLIMLKAENFHSLKLSQWIQGSKLKTWGGLCRIGMFGAVLWTLWRWPRSKVMMSKLLSMWRGVCGGNKHFIELQNILLMYQSYFCGLWTLYSLGVRFYTPRRLISWPNDRYSLVCWIGFEGFYAKVVPNSHFWEKFESCGIFITDWE